MQVSGNHISTVKVGSKVIASGKIIHKGSTTHIWNVDILTTTGKLVSSVRIVNYIVKKK
jgi:acyl-coenzyme A thioesterase PaaI-like protein